LASFLFKPKATITLFLPMVVLTGSVFFLWSWMAYQFKSQPWDLQPWQFGWILPKHEVGAIAIGISLDFATLAVGMFASFLVLVSQIYFWSQDERIESCRRLGAIGVGLVGVMVTWASTTLWGSFVGLAFCLLGGVLALGVQWELGRPSLALHHFAVERVCALGLSILGAGSLGGEPSATSTTAIIMLVMGFLIFLQPFPLLAAVTKESIEGTFGRVFLVYALPVLAVVGIFFRHAGSLHVEDSQVILGPVGAIGAALAALCGLLQTNWRTSFALWVSSAGMLMISAFGIVGPRAAVAVAVSVFVAALSLAVLGDASESSDKDIKGAQKTAGSAHAVLAGVSIYCGLGGPIFVGASGYSALLTAATANGSALGGLVAVTLFLVSALGFLSAWRLQPFLRALTTSSRKRSAWCSALIIASGLGVLWMGTITGYESTVFSDHLVGSILIGAIREKGSTSSGLPMIGAHLLILCLAGVISWWGYHSGKSWSQLGGKNTQRFLVFVAAGYETDRLFEALLAGIRYVGTWVRHLVDDRMSSFFLPRALYQSVTALGRVGFHLDTTLSQLWIKVFATLSEGMTSGLRLAHTGNLQWYITFAIGSGITLLIHFLLNQSR
jgi:hypothetical protein